MINLKAVLIFLISSASCVFAQDRQMANLNDVSTVDGVMNAYYESVSGHPGQRDVARILSLYMPGGKINIRMEGDKPVHNLIEDVIKTEQFLTISEDFFEREISRDEQRFGDMVNVISTYGISDAMENKNYRARGVTIFQLYYDNDRWWILSSMYQREIPGRPLPAKLLD